MIEKKKNCRYHLTKICRYLYWTKCYIEYLFHCCNKNTKYYVLPYLLNPKPPPLSIHLSLTPVIKYSPYLSSDLRQEYFPCFSSQGLGGNKAISQMFNVALSLPQLLLFEAVLSAGAILKRF